MNGYQGVGGGGSPQQGTMELLGWWVCFLSGLPRWLHNCMHVSQLTIRYTLQRANLPVWKLYLNKPDF